MALFALLTFQLIEAFKMKTIIFTKETRVDQEPLMTNISTYQDQANMSPYMMAFYLWNRGCQSVSYTITALIYESYGNLAYDGWETREVPITLESCTI
jgi:hypothetical protein